MLVELEKFFLNTIWGVILLGALGSLLGVLLLKLLKLLSDFMPEAKVRLTHSVMNAVGYEIELSDKIENTLLSQDKHTKFLIYNSDLLQKLNHRFIALCLSLISSGYVYLEYSLTKPELLFTLFGFMFYTGGNYFRHYIRYQFYLDKMGFKDLEVSVKEELQKRKKTSIHIAKRQRQMRK
ncbi:hypothetical protein [Vibrio campbellii]|uniref:hypothetical protein n=1 Tax=Vibrio campbellii TaxID=680 RepID=UPI0040567AA5